MTAGNAAAGGAGPAAAPAILVLDDEKNIRLMACMVLKKAGHYAVAAATVAEALAEMDRTEFALALTDYMMPGGDGFAFLAALHERAGPRPPVVFMTAHGSTDVAVRAMRAGAADYIAKPFTADELLHAVGRNLNTARLQREVAGLKAQVATLTAAGAGGVAGAAGMTAESPAMKALLATAERVAASGAPVLIEGETGSGKELLARFVHDRGPRRDGPFVAVNCGALHPELLLSELFGHRRGAFTGAVEDRTGRFEAAGGGTLFLDEIGELDEAAQVKLLRVLQEGTFERLGEGRTVRADARIVAATNRSLERMVAEGTFRADLFYRLAVVTLAVPPLRARPEDMAALAGSLLAEFGAAAGRPGLRWSAAARGALAARRWPGNIRELRNTAQRAVIFAPEGSDEIGPELAAPTCGADATAAGAGPEPGAGADMAGEALAGGWSLEDLEREYMARLLARDDLKLADVGSILRIDPATLYRKRKRYGL